MLKTALWNKFSISGSKHLGFVLYEMPYMKGFKLNSMSLYYIFKDKPHFESEGHGFFFWKKLRGKRWYIDVLCVRKSFRYITRATEQCHPPTTQLGLN